MEGNNKLNVVLSFVSFVSSIVSFFVMYYIFAIIAFILCTITLNDEKSRKLSLTSIVIVCVTFVIKLISIIVANGNLPEWLTNGLF